MPKPIATEKPVVACVPFSTRDVNRPMMTKWLLVSESGPEFTLQALPSRAFQFR